ncbi:HalOD1 output domain-containing protein [Halopiger djelfimassiliensis]|uniref:HalOD1 output domain-containing protein n=1 Tax=Halopiger djelfimassiliensis TaxID=1293047 RepID=UPI000AC944AA|nr:HalOD1 output domain-containing protein [Halopiger djelfimassiliensis]
MIVNRVASLEGTDPTALPPLYDIIDPDALERLVESAANGDFCVEFTYCGYRVTIENETGVTVAELDTTPN